MKNQEKAIILLLDRLIAKQRISRQKFMELLDEAAIPCSDSTITRLLKNIDTNLGICIKYSRGRETYFIVEEDTDPHYHKNYFWLKNLYFTTAIRKRFAENKLLSNYISIGNTQKDQCLHLVEVVLEAIKSRTKLQLTYQPFYEDCPKDYTVSPLFLRTFDNRWYIVTADDLPDRDHFIFAFDRIKSIKKLTTSFKTPDFPTPETFANTYGVSYFDAPAEEIILRVSKWQYHYLETLPLHPSQKKLRETKKGVEISLKLCWNYELLTWILKQGAGVALLKPAHLRKKVKAELQKMANLYKKNQ